MSIFIKVFHVCSISPYLFVPMVKTTCQWYHFPSAVLSKMHKYLLSLDVCGSGLKWIDGRERDTEKIFILNYIILKILHTMCAAAYSLSFNDDLCHSTFSTFSFSTVSTSSSEVETSFYPLVDVLCKRGCWMKSQKGNVSTLWWIRYIPLVIRDDFIATWIA